MKHLYIILSLFVTLFISGCVEDLDLSHLKQDPKLVVNCIAQKGNPVTAVISRTFFAYESHQEIVLPDAEVRLFVNGEDKGKMTAYKVEEGDYRRGFYISSYSPEVDDMIRVEVIAEGYPKATAESTVPHGVQIDQIEIKRWIVNNYGYENIGYKYDITFTDPVDEKNYYFLFCEVGLPVWSQETNRFTGEYQWAYHPMDYTKEPLFMEEISALEHVLDYNWLNPRGRAFPDQLINGKTYTITLLDTHWISWLLESSQQLYGLNFDLNAIPEEERLPVMGRASLYSLSEPFYLYLRSLIGLEDGRLINDLVYAGLAEPVKIYNNIQNGLGILATCHSQHYTVELGHFKETNEGTN